MAKRTCRPAAVRNAVPGAGARCAGNSRGFRFKAIPFWPKQSRFQRPDRRYKTSLFVQIMRGAGPVILRIDLSDTMNIEGDICLKKNLLAAAAGIAIVAPGAAFADAAVYGKFNVGLEDQKFQTTLGGDAAATVLDSTWKLKDNNNSSRLGFKGTQDLGSSGLTAIYQLEYGIDPDGNESGGTPLAGVFSERDIFVGVQGGFGQLKVGKFNTPVKSFTAKADFFDDQSIGDDQHLLTGETRANNLIQYSTPKFADAFTVAVAFTPGEGRTALDSAARVDKGIADSLYAAVVYDTKRVYAAVTYANKEAGSLKFDGATAGVDILRGAVYVNPVAALEFSALLQQAKGVDQKGATNGNQLGGNRKETTFLVGAAYSIDAWKFKAALGQTKGDQTDVKRDDVSLDIDYKLGKPLIAQLYYIGYKDKNRTVGGITDPKSNVTGVALVYSF